MRTGSNGVYTLTARLASTPDRIAEYVDGLGETAIRWKPDAGRLSILENVAHIRDLELEATTVRIRRMLTEDDPKLEGFEGGDVVAAERYNEENFADAFAAFKLGRKRNVTRLQTISDDDLDRRATMGGSVLTLRDVLARLCDHDEEHVSDIEALALDTRALAEEIPPNSVSLETVADDGDADC
jgi:DinB superfamily